MTDQVHIELDGGKYTYVLHEDGRQEALRYGEPWRELTGDNLIYNMADEIIRLRQELAELRNAQGEPVGVVVVYKGSRVGMMADQDIEAGTMLYKAMLAAAPKPTD